MVYPSAYIPARLPVRRRLRVHAILFLSKSGMRTVPIGIVGELIRGDAYSWGRLIEGTLLGSVPAALNYFFFVKYCVAGLTAGAVKG